MALDPTDFSFTYVFSPIHCLHSLIHSLLASFPFLHPPSVLALFSLPLSCSPLFPVVWINSNLLSDEEAASVFCVCERETETDINKERGRTCFCTLHLSPVATQHHQPPSLWSLSASVLLSVHGGLGMDGWSGERGRQNKHGDRQRERERRVELKSTKISLDKLT